MTMLKYHHRRIQVIVGGCGGTGSALLHFLPRLINVIDKKICLTLVDGDVVEEKNVLRQNFDIVDIGKNKAETLHKKYQQKIGSNMSYFPNYLGNARDVMDVMINGMEHYILIGCFDNTNARKIFHDAFEAAYSVTYLDAGNSEYTGQVVYGLKFHEMDILKPIGYYAPEMIEPGEETEEEPEEEEVHYLGCDTAPVDQTMGANALSAHVLFNYLTNILTKGESRYMTWFDSTDITTSHKKFNEAPFFYPDGITGLRWRDRRITVEDHIKVQTA